jgi:hypothetical protein
VRGMTLGLSYSRAVSHRSQSVHAQPQQLLLDPGTSMHRNDQASSSSVPSTKVAVGLAASSSIIGADGVSSFSFSFSFLVGLRLLCLVSYLANHNQPTRHPPRTHARNTQHARTEREVSCVASTALRRCAGPSWAPAGGRRVRSCRLGTRREALSSAKW